MNVIQIITTTNSKENAEKITKALLEKRLAACIQIIGPIQSSYWWQGKIEEDSEWILFIKTKKELYSEVEDIIKENHNYTVPEILAFEAINGNKDYIEWLLKETINSN